MAVPPRFMKEIYFELYGAFIVFEPINFYNNAQWETREDGSSKNWKIDL